MIFPEALETPDEFGRFAQAVDAHLIANMTEFGKSPLLSSAELAKLGYAAVLFPVTTLRVAMKAVENALQEIARMERKKACSTRCRLGRSFMTCSTMKALKNATAAISAAEGSIWPLHRALDIDRLDHVSILRPRQ